MLSFVLLTALIAWPDEAARPKGKPAAMILELREKVEIRPDGGPARSAEVGDLLYPGEALTVPADGVVVVSILGAGVRESIKPGVEARIGPKGCSPVETILSRKEQPRAVSSAMKLVKATSVDGRKAGVALRSGPEQAQAITPAFGSKLASDRPSLAWPPAQGATTYLVRMSTGGGRDVWKLESQQARVEYPADRVALQPGSLYRWEVTDQDYRRTASGEFVVETPEERIKFAELKALGESGDAADRYSASLAYRRMVAYPEASALLEQLSRERPDVATYRRDLADLDRIAGLASPEGPNGSLRR